MRRYIRKPIYHSAYSRPEARTIDQRIRHWLEIGRDSQRVELNPNNWREYLARRRLSLA